MNQSLPPSLSSEENPTISFHPIACLPCRNSHKPCDKKLPQCDKCVRKGITCEYTTPKRSRFANSEAMKKKRKNLIGDDAINKTLIGLIPQTLSKKDVIGYYFSMCVGEVFTFDKSLVEKFILLSDNSSMDEEEYQESKRVKALFYAMKALVEQRFGMDSLKSLEKCRELLSKNFDNFTNYTIACTYKLLSRYEMGNGRINYSRFYLNCTKSYFDGNEPKNSFERNMKQLIRTSEIVDSHSEMGHMFVRSLPEIFEAITNVPLPDEIIKILQQDHDHSINYSDKMKVMEIIVNHTFEFSREKSILDKTEEQRKFIDGFMENVKCIFLNGLRISMLINSGFEQNEILEESALKVTYASESEYFPLFTVFVLPYLALASRFHLEIVKQIESGQKENKNPIDYYEILAKDLRSLKLLASRYKRVEVSYGSMMNEMEETLKKLESSQQQESQQTVEFISPPSDELHPASSILFDEQPLSFLFGIVNETAHSLETPNNNQDSENQVYDDFTQMLSPEFSFF